MKKSFPIWYVLSSSCWLLAGSLNLYAGSGWVACMNFLCAAIWGGMALTELKPWFDARKELKNKQMHDEKIRLRNEQQEKLLKQMDFWAPKEKEKNK